MGTKKCNPPKKVSKAGGDLASSKTTKKQKSKAGTVLNDHKNKKHK